MLLMGVGYRVDSQRPGGPGQNGPPDEVLGAQGAEVAAIPAAGRIIAAHGKGCLTP